MEIAVTTMYGIKNCDTIKKARAALEGASIAYDFHDYKSAGVDAARLQGWVADCGWEKLLNRVGTTFKKLADADKQDIDAAKAVALMLASPSMIKRPVLEHKGRVIIGFDPAVYGALGG